MVNSTTCDLGLDTPANTRVCSPNTAARTPEPRTRSLTYTWLRTPQHSPHQDLGPAAQPASGRARVGAENPPERSADCRDFNIYNISTPEPVPASFPLPDLPLPPLPDSNSNRLELELELELESTPDSPPSTSTHSLTHSHTPPPQKKQKIPPQWPPPPLPSSRPPPPPSP